jgi:hypothetical protein
MVSRPKPRPHDTGVDGLVIYGDSQKLNDFFLGIELASVPVETSDTKNVKAHTVRRYPGDPGFQRDAHEASYLKGYPQKRIALPGKRAWAYRDGTILGVIDLRSAMQFTFTGSFKQLVDYANGHVGAFSYWLKSPSGRPVRINLPILP